MPKENLFKCSPGAIGSTVVTIICGRSPILGAIHYWAVTAGYRGSKRRACLCCSSIYGTNSRLSPLPGSPSPGSIGVRVPGQPPKSSPGVGRDLLGEATFYLSQLLETEYYGCSLRQTARGEQRAAFAHGTVFTRAAIVAQLRSATP